MNKQEIIESEVKTHNSGRNELGVFDVKNSIGTSRSITNILGIKNPGNLGKFKEKTKYYIGEFRVTQQHADAIKELLVFPKEYFFTKQYFKTQTSCLYNIYKQRQRELGLASNKISEGGWDKIYDLLCGIIDKEILDLKDRDRLKKIVSEIKFTGRGKSWNNTVGTPGNYTKEENIELFDIKGHVFKQKQFNTLLKLLEQPDDYYFSRYKLNIDYNSLYNVFRSYYDSLGVKAGDRDWNYIVKILNKFLNKLFNDKKINSLQLNKAKKFFDSFLDNKAGGKGKPNSEVIMTIGRYQITEVHVNTLKEILNSKGALRRTDMNGMYNPVFCLFRYKVKGENIKIENSFRDNFVNILTQFIDSSKGHFTANEKKVLKEKVSQLNSRNVIDVKVRLEKYNTELENNNFLNKYSVLNIGGKEIVLTKRGKILNALFDLDYDLAIDYFSSHAKTNQGIIIFISKAKDDDIKEQEGKIVNFCKKENSNKGQPSTKQVEDKGYTTVRLDFIYDLLLNKYSNNQTFDHYLYNIGEALEKKGVKILDRTKYDTQKNVHSILNKFNSGEFWDIDELL